MDRWPDWHGRCLSPLARSRVSQNRPRFFELCICTASCNQCSHNIFIRQNQASKHVTMQYSRNIFRPNAADDEQYCSSPASYQHEQISSPGSLASLDGINNNQNNYVVHKRRYVPMGDTASFRYRTATIGTTTSTRRATAYYPSNGQRCPAMPTFHDEKGDDDDLLDPHAAAVEFMARQASNKNLHPSCSLWPTSLAVRFASRLEFEDDY